MIWALKNWRIIAAGLAVIGVLGALWYIDSRAYKRGVEETKAKYERALFEARQKHLFELSKMDRKYDTTSKEISKVSDNCFNAGDGYLNNWLRVNKLTGE